MASSRFKLVAERDGVGTRFIAPLLIRSGPVGMNRVSVNLHIGSASFVLGRGRCRRRGDADDDDDGGGVGLVAEGGGGAPSNISILRKLATFRSSYSSDSFSLLLDIIPNDN